MTYVQDYSLQDCFIFYNDSSISFFFTILLFYLFIYFWLCWVFVAVQAFSLVAANGAKLLSNCGAWASHCEAFLFWWLLLLWSRRRQWQPTPVLLPGKSHGCRSLVGCSPWSRWVRHDWETSLSLFTFTHWRRKWQPTPVFLPGESQGPGEPGGLPSMGSHRVGHDWSDLAAAAAFCAAQALGWEAFVSCGNWA